MDNAIQFRLCSAEHILSLRARILRDGRHVDTARFAEDNFNETRHYCVDAGPVAIACLSLIRRESTGAWVFQLRGMAVETSWQKRGMGQRLLRYAEQDIRRLHNKTVIWCNVRNMAIPFYTKAGYSIISEPFEIAGIGPHVVMQKNVSPRI